jgi:hypothetical protein
MRRIGGPNYNGHNLMFLYATGANMAQKMPLSFFAVVGVVVLSSCGTYTPDKDPFQSDATNDQNTRTSQGMYEAGIVDHVTCEIGQALTLAKRLKTHWIEDWGVSVTQTITAEDQTGLAPGVSAVSPLQNVIFPFSNGGNFISPQSFSLNFGGTASANSIRTETIQYTFRNKDVLAVYKEPCLKKTTQGVMIDGDLKIREFIYDKLYMISTGNVCLLDTPELPATRRACYNTFTEEITFVAAYGGSFTPTWKLARVTANTGSNLIVSQRTNTNDLIITLGPLKYPDVPPHNGPVVLSDTAMSQHQARVQAAAIAVSITGQSH